MVDILINEKACRAEEGETVIQVLDREGIDVPRLCYHEALSPYGACRLCLIEVVAGGRPGVTASCALPAAAGLEIKTDTPEVIRMREVVFEMYLAEAPASEEIRLLAKKYGVEKTRFDKADLSASGDKCVLCGRCARVCSDAIGVGAIDYAGRGTETSINTPWYDQTEACIGCGACAFVCPAGAVKITDEGDERIMETWQGTKLNLTKCAEAHKMFATEKCIALVKKRYPELPEDLKNLCADARRLKLAGEMHLKPRKK